MVFLCNANAISLVPNPQIPPQPLHRQTPFLQIFPLRRRFFSRPIAPQGRPLTISHSRHPLAPLLQNQVFPRGQVDSPPLETHRFQTPPSASSQPLDLYVLQLRRFRSGTPGVRQNGR